MLFVPIGSAKIAYVFKSLRRLDPMKKIEDVKKRNKKSGFIQSWDWTLRISSTIRFMKWLVEEITN